MLYSKDESVQGVAVGLCGPSVGLQQYMIQCGSFATLSAFQHEQDDAQPTE